MRRSRRCSGPVRRRLLSTLGGRCEDQHLVLLFRSPRRKPGPRSNPQSLLRLARSEGATSPDAQAESGPRLSPGRAGKLAGFALNPGRAGDAPLVCGLYLGMVASFPSCPQARGALACAAQQADRSGHHEPKQQGARQAAGVVDDSWDFSGSDLWGLCCLVVSAPRNPSTPVQSIKPEMYVRICPQPTLGSPFSRQRPAGRNPRSVERGATADSALGRRQRPP